MDKARRLTYRINLSFGPEIYERIRGRASERCLDVHEWAMRTILTAISARPPETRYNRERRREDVVKLLSLAIGLPHAGTQPADHHEPQTTQAPQCAQAQQA